MSDQIPLSVQNAFPAAENDQNMHISEQSLGHQQQPSGLSFGSSAQQENQSNVDGFENAEEQNSHHTLTESGAQQRSLQEMEAEAAKLRELNSQLDSLQQSQPENDTPKSEADAKSVYVGNVDYGATPLELQQHFAGSGVVERVTIMSNKHTGQPKGFAYLEFDSEDAANKAVATLDGSTFRERELKVSLKRTNIPGLTSRGGFRGRGRGRGALRGRGIFRGRGGFRGGPRFSPY